MRENDNGTAPGCAALDEGVVCIRNGGVVSARDSAEWLSNADVIQRVPIEAGDAVSTRDEVNKVTFAQFAKEWTQNLSWIRDPTPPYGVTGFVRYTHSLHQPFVVLSIGWQVAATGRSEQLIRRVWPNRAGSWRLAASFARTVLAERLLRCQPSDHPGRLGRLGRGGELGVQAHQRVCGAVVRNQPQNHLGPLIDHPAGAVPQLLQHGLDAPPLRLVPNRLMQPEHAALPDLPQDVHSQRRQAAHQRIGVELARGRSRDFVRAAVGVQRHYRCRIDAARQRRRPAIEFVVWHDQVLSASTGGARHQTQHGGHPALQAGFFDILLPQGLALAPVGALPRRVGGAALPDEPCRAGAARVPFDEPDQLRRTRRVHRLQRGHQRHRIKHRVQPRQHTLPGAGRAQPLRLGLDTARVLFGTLGRLLCVWAQRLSQEQPAAAQLGRQRAGAGYTGVGALHAFLDRASVVHDGGVDVQRQPCAAQHPVLRRMGVQPPLNHRQQTFRQRGRYAVHSLARRWAGKQQPDAQRLLAERIAAQLRDRGKVALGRYQRTEVASRDVIARHAAHRQCRVDLGHHACQRSRQVPRQHQAGSGRDVVAELPALDRLHDRVAKCAQRLHQWAPLPQCSVIEVRARIEVKEQSQILASSGVGAAAIETLRD
jgi:hypothetical protein